MLPPCVLVSDHPLCTQGARTPRPSGCRRRPWAASPHPEIGPSTPQRGVLTADRSPVQTVLKWTTYVNWGSTGKMPGSQPVEEGWTETSGGLRAALLVDCTICGGGPRAILAPRWPRTDRADRRSMGTRRAALWPGLRSGHRPALAPDGYVEPVRPRARRADCAASPTAWIIFVRFSSDCWTTAWCSSHTDVLMAPPASVGTQTVASPSNEMRV